MAAASTDYYGLPHHMLDTYGSGIVLTIALSDWIHEKISAVDNRRWLATELKLGGRLCFIPELASKRNYLWRD